MDNAGVCTKARSNQLLIEFLWDSRFECNSELKAVPEKQKTLK